MQTRSNDSNVQHLKLDLEYEQTNENIRMLTDVRFKLLAFLPTLGGVAAFALSYLGFTLSENLPQGGSETFPVYFVGIRCPVEVAESREKERGDRAPGGARYFHNFVHAYGIYDLQVDSARNSPDECARQIKDWIQTDPSPTAFGCLKNILEI